MNVGCSKLANSEEKVFRRLQKTESEETEVTCCYYYYRVLRAIIMLSASRRQPHLLRVSAVDRHQTWSMDRSWRCDIVWIFPQSHSSLSVKPHFLWHAHYSGPGLPENDSAVTTDVCEHQNREVGLCGLTCCGTALHKRGPATRKARSPMQRSPAFRSISLKSRLQWAMNSAARLSCSLRQVSTLSLRSCANSTGWRPLSGPCSNYL